MLLIIESRFFPTSIWYGKEQGACLNVLRLQFYFVNILIKFIIFIARLFHMFDVHVLFRILATTLLSMFVRPWKQRKTRFVYSFSALSFANNQFALQQLFWFFQFFSYWKSFTQHRWAGFFPLSWRCRTTSIRRASCSKVLEPLWFSLT